MVEELDALGATSVISWGCPVPFFGALATSRVATVGINPSSREFVDDQGVELQGPFQRLPTLRSLDLPAWRQADARHLREVLRGCSDYFGGNPYDRWFRVLDQLLAGTGSSFYDPESPACHLDLVPYATSTKWGALSAHERRALLQRSGDVLGMFLREAPIDLLVLNGQAVVEAFEDLASTRLIPTAMPRWALPRERGRPVGGVAYAGLVDSLGGVQLERHIEVVGYNHNVQSSYGVTREALDEMTRWIGEAWRNTQ